MTVQSLFLPSPRETKRDQRFNLQPNLLALGFWHERHAVHTPLS
jgi:hypothetical protein